MSMQRRGQATGSVALPLVISLLLGALWAAKPGTLTPACPGTPHWSHTPSGVACQTARRQWVLSQEAIARQFEVVEAWDPKGIVGIDGENWRRQCMVCDQMGYLRRARESAQQAVALARTPSEVYRATLVLARIERDSGHRTEEQIQARRLLALAPADRSAAMFLRDAARGRGSDPQEGVAGSTAPREMNVRK